MEFSEMGNDPYSAYKEELLSSSRAQWYHGFERGLQEGINILMELETFEPENTAGIDPEFFEMIRGVMKMATDWCLHYMDEKKNEVLVSLLDEQTAEESWEVKQHG